MLALPFYIFFDILYYLADVALKYALLGYNRKMLDGAMENIVFLELKRRGYDVYIGKNDVKEIDFLYVNVYAYESNPLKS